MQSRATSFHEHAAANREETIRKLLALYDRPGTPGEKQAAEHILRTRFGVEPSQRTASQAETPFPHQRPVEPQASNPFFRQDTTPKPAHVAWSSVIAACKTSKASHQKNYDDAIKDARYWEAQQRSAKGHKAFKVRTSLLDAKQKAETYKWFIDNKKYKGGDRENT